MSFLSLLWGEGLLSNRLRVDSYLCQQALLRWELTRFVSKVPGLEVGQPLPECEASSAADYAYIPDQVPNSGGTL